MIKERMLLTKISQQEYESTSKYLGGEMKETLKGYQALTLLPLLVILGSPSRGPVGEEEDSVDTGVGPEDERQCHLTQLHAAC